jgi:hypothetical protein
VTVSSRADLRASKTVTDGNGGQPMPGDPLTWTITLDKDADGSVDATATTDVDGGYSFTGLLAPVGLPPLQRARPSATSWWAQSASAGISTGLMIATERPRSVTTRRAPDRTRVR